MGGEELGNFTRHKPSRSTLEDETDGFLRHKLPFSCTSGEEGPLIVSANPDFDLERLLGMLSFTATPPPSPISLQPVEPVFDDKPSTGLSHSSSPFDLGSTVEKELELATELFSLSPLASPTPSPPSSPISPLKNPAFQSDLKPFDESSDVDSADADRSTPRTVSDCATNKSPPLPSVLCTPPPPSANATPISNEPGGDSKGSNVPELTHNARYRARNHQRRNEKRQRDRLQSFSSYEPRTNVKKESAPAIQVDLATENCSAAAAGFVGLNDGTRGKKAFKVEELVGERSKYGFEYVGWNGIIRRTVADARGRKVAFLAGQPDDEDWMQLMQQAADSLELGRPRLSVSKEDRVHRRGAFPAVPCGISHGGGSKCPGNLRNNAENAAVVDELSHMPCFKRLAGFATSVMASKAPKLYQYYVEHLAELHKRHPELKRLFPCSVFAAASYNFGPRTACYKHKDFANLPFGLCTVTALGNFDPRLGGHLILWECKLVIEFPPGATILLPSAIIAHSNTPVQDNERRYSFAQYTAGGLFRWVDNDCMLANEYYASLSAM